MIDFFSAGTPNGYKVAIALEETGLPYTFHHVRLQEGEQRAPWYLELNPNGRIPTIVDRSNHDFAVFESGAILLYLADLTGRFLPDVPRQRSLAIQWLMFEMGDLGPMMGQAGYFLHGAPERIDHAVTRYLGETRRLLGVLDGHLADSRFLSGEDYTVADIATFPWVRVHDTLDIALDGTPNLKRWFDEIAARPAVQRGLKVPDQA